MTEREYITREQVIKAIKKLPNQLKIGEPADFAIHSNDENVREASRLWDLFCENLDKDSVTPEARLARSLEIDTILVDAGTASEAYITDVLDYLEQDIENAKNQNMFDLAQQFQARINQLRSLVNE